MTSYYMIEINIKIDLRQFMYSCIEVLCDCFPIQYVTFLILKGFREYDVQIGDKNCTSLRFYHITHYHLGVYHKFYGRMRLQVLSYKISK